MRILFSYKFRFSKNNWIRSVKKGWKLKNNWKIQSWNKKTRKVTDEIQLCFLVFYLATDKSQLNFKICTLSTEQIQLKIEKCKA